MLQSYVCPVCNGLEQLHTVCPQCRGSCENDGRMNDYFGPYSPYRPIEEVGLSNGLADVRSHRCAHVLHCSDCGYVFHQFVAERRV